VAVSRLLRGVSPDPGRFLYSVNRVLLRVIRPGDDWEEFPDRKLLAEYLEMVNRFLVRYPDGVALDPRNLGARLRLEGLASELGYKVKFRSRGVEVQPRTGDRWPTARRVAEALGWDMVGAAERLQEGKPVKLPLVEETVPCPYSLERWGRIRGFRTTPRNALRRLAQDQSWGLVLAGLDEISHETREWLTDDDLRWLLGAPSVRFFRYASALQIQDGRLKVPGGEAMAEVWSQLVGAPVTAPRRFLHALFGDRSGELAFLWHTFSFEPPRVTRFWMGNDAQAVLGALNGLQNEDSFDAPRGNAPGFATLVRSVEIGEDGIQLPPSPGVWYQAVYGKEPPKDLGSLIRAVTRAKRRTMGYQELVHHIMNAHVRVGGYDRSVIPRVVAVANLFGNRRDLLTAGNVILLARMADVAPAALEPLPDLAPADPALLRRYLLLVAGLPVDPKDPEAELLVVNFQGGTELLRMLAHSDGLPVPVRDRLLGSWLEIFSGAQDPFGVAPQALGWLDELSQALATAPDDAPGRGPAERSLLAALAGCHDPQSFTWNGLDYRGRRGRDIAAVMAQHLKTQSVPSLDQLLKLHRGFDRLSALCKDQRLDEARALAQDLTEGIDALPGPAFEPPLRSNALKRRVAPVERRQLLKVLGKVMKRKKGRQLTSLADDVERAHGLMAYELRPVLLGQAYVWSMRESTNLLFDTPNLVWSHSLYRNITQVLVGDTPWQEAMLVQHGDSQLGAHVVGYVGGVGPALAQLGMPASSAGTNALSQNERHDALWSRLAATVPWQRFEPDLTAVAAVAAQAGDGLVRRAAAREPAALAFVGLRVPLARLDDGGALVGPAERLAVGLAALAGDAFGPAQPDLVDQDLRSRFAGLTAKLPGWRRRLDALGIATGPMDGHRVPSLRTWPPHEALETNRDPEALWTRELVDMHAAVVTYLGRNQLAGEVGEDLMQALIGASAAEVRPTGKYDWKAFVQWVNTIDDSSLDERMRTCLKEGKYLLQSF